MSASPLQTARPPRSNDVQGRRAPLVCEVAIVASSSRLEAAAASSPGTRHRVNEDCHSAFDSDVPLFVVADGVGGGALASRASRQLVARLHAGLARARIDDESVRQALLDADHEIRACIASRTPVAGAATVALCAAKDTSLERWLIAWVGDCRAYRVRGTDDMPADLLTVDDTYRQLGERPPSGGSPDDPARMIGNGAIDSPNVTHVELLGGEMLVLCSDGVHRHAEPAVIAGVLRGGAPLAHRCRELVAFARAHGSHDDATVLAVRRTERGRDAAETSHCEIAKP
jgi:protein phosphatase